MMIFALYLAQVTQLECKRAREYLLFFSESHAAAAAAADDDAAILLTFLFC